MTETAADSPIDFEDLARACSTATGKLELRGSIAKLELEA